MHRRPRLHEAVEVLKKLSAVSADAKQALEEYYVLKSTGQEFYAAHFAVEIIDHYYHLTNVQECANG